MGIVFNDEICKSHHVFAEIIDAHFDDQVTQAEFTSFNTTFSTMSANADMLTDLLGMMGQTPDLFAKSCAVQLILLLVLAAIFAAVASLRKRSFKQ